MKNFEKSSLFHTEKTPSKIFLFHKSLKENWEEILFQETGRVPAKIFI